MTEEKVEVAKFDDGVFHPSNGENLKKSQKKKLMKKLSLSEEVRKVEEASRV